MLCWESWYRYVYKFFVLNCFTLKLRLQIRNLTGFVLELSYFWNSFFELKHKFCHSAHLYLPYLTPFIIRAALIHPLCGIGIPSPPLILELRWAENVLKDLPILKKKLLPLQFSDILVANSTLTFTPSSFSNPFSYYKCLY